MESARSELLKGSPEVSQLLLLLVFQGKLRSGCKGCFISWLYEHLMVCEERGSRHTMNGES